MSSQEGRAVGQCDSPATERPLAWTLRLLRWTRWVVLAFAAAHLLYEVPSEILPALPGSARGWAEIFFAGVVVPGYVFLTTRWAETALRRSRQAGVVLRRIDDVSRRSMDLDEILQNGLDDSKATLQADTGVVFVLEPDRTSLTLRAHRGVSAAFISGVGQVKVGTGPKAGGGVNGLDITETKPTVLKVSADSEERFAVLARQTGVEQVVRIPLLSGGIVVGLLALGMRKRRVLPPHELELLESIGAHLGAAAHRALLYDDLRRQLEERKRAEAEVRQEKRFSEALLQNLAGGVIAVDESGKQVMVNRAFLDMTGFEEQELLGQVPPFKYWAEEEIPRITEDLKNLSKSCAGTSEMIFKRKNGDRFNALVTMGQIHQDGDPAVFLGTVVDITDRKRTEEQLQTTNQTLQALVQGSPAAILVQDAQRNVALWNPAAERMFGWTASEVIGRPNPIVPPELAEEVEDRFIRIRRGEYPPDIETRRMRKDGSRVDVSLSVGTLRDADGAVIGGIGLFMDISERKRAEVELRLRTQEREALLTIAATLAQPLAFSRKLSRVLEELRRVVQADVVLLRTVDQERHQLTIVASFPIAPELVRPASVPLAEGVAGLAFQQGRPVVANDYGLSPESLREVVDQNVKSVVAVPVRLGEKTLGVFVVRAREPGHFTTERVRILAGIADGVAVLLESASLQEAVNSQLDQARARLAAFQDAAGRLALEDNPGSAPQRLLSVARDMAGARFGALALWDASGSISVWHHDGVSAEEAGFIGSPPAGLGMLGLIRDEQKSIRVPDISGHPDAVGLPPGHPRIGSFLGVPVRCRPGLRGALYLAEKVGASEFTPEDERLLNLFAVLAGVFLENAQLYAEVLRERRTLEAIQASMTEALGVFDAAGRMIYFNQAASAYTGVPIEQVIGRPAEDIRQALTSFLEPPEAAETFFQAVQKKIDLPRSLKVTITSPSTRHLNVEIFPITGDAGEPMVGFLARDVSKELELERRRDQFVAIASHELRTPMTMILGFSELLVNRDPSPEQRKQWAERIQRDCQKLAAIVDDMLNVSRIQSGRMRLECVPTGLLGVVEEAVEDIRTTGDTREIAMEIPSDFPRVVADRAKLGQVLRNLLTNAVKYSPPGGAINVSARHEPERARAVVSVADHGIGISPSDRETLFTTFHRIRRPETENVGGTGLGLYIVKGFVELMGGEVWLESELNRGSTFYFSLPCPEIQEVS